MPIRRPKAFYQIVQEAAAGVSTFLGLTDTPSSYSGQGGKVVQVNSGGTALEFATAASGGVWVLLDSETTTAATTEQLSLSGVTLGDYQLFVIIGYIKLAADDLYLRMGNPTIQTNNYYWKIGGTSDTKLGPIIGPSGGFDSGFCIIEMQGMESGEVKLIRSRYSSVVSGELFDFYTDTGADGGAFDDTGTVTEFQILSDSNFTGEWRLYGIKDA